MLTNRNEEISHLLHQPKLLLDPKLRSFSRVTQIWIDQNLGSTFSWSIIYIKFQVFNSHARNSEKVLIYKETEMQIK